MIDDITKMLSCLHKDTDYLMIEYYILNLRILIDNLNNGSIAYDTFINKSEATVKYLKYKEIQENIIEKQVFDVIQRFEDTCNQYYYNRQC